MKQPLFYVCLCILWFSIGYSFDYQKPYFPITTNIPMPGWYREVTGYDTIQVIRDDSNHLRANFCYPNKWEFEKFRKDTVFIHDTFYTAKQYNNVGTVYIDQR